ncbi:hypothetical protein [Candidatus Thiosymbion oneisti]|uniref:hypothetical protein n=1 Tax=Candidatus Thiosymbion oneisti TaxID=589554 RepID=UPI00106227DC|nr:hypothetical protein [Candidatus Thiosymbion oneisti]
MIGHIALVLALVIWPLIGLSANAADIRYMKQRNVKVTEQLHTVHVYQIDKQAIAANKKASSEVKKEAARFPDGLVFAKGKGWWMAVYANLGGQQICSIYPKTGTKGYGNLIKESGIKKDYPLPGIDKWGGHPKDTEKAIKDQGLTYVSVKWDDKQGTTFKKKDDLVKMLFGDCELRDWEGFLEVINNPQEQPTDTTHAGKEEGHSGSFNALRDLYIEVMKGQRQLETKIHELTEEQKQTRQQNTELQPLLDKKLSLLYWLTGLLIALALIIIAFYPFQYWLANRQNEKVRNRLDNMEHRVRGVRGEIARAKQVQVREAALQPTLKAPAPLNGLLRQSKDIVRDLTNNESRFQQIFHRIEAIGGKRAMGVVSHRGHTDGRLVPTKRDTFRELLGNLSKQYHPQTDALDPDQAYLQALEIQVAKIDAGVRAIPVLSDWVLELGDLIDEVDRNAANREEEHRRAIDQTRDEMRRAADREEKYRRTIDQIRDEMRCAADREKEHRRTIDQVHKELGEIKDELNRTRDNEKALTQLKAEYETYLSRDLVAAGYLDTGTDLKDPQLSEHLPDAIKVASQDTGHRSELMGYVRSLTALRDYLETSRIQGLPYFRPAGLTKLLNKLREKKNFKTLYTSETPKEALQGQWHETLQLLYRALLLIKTYWPEGADKELMLRLRQAQATATILLERYGIAPHVLRLPVDWQWIEERRDWVEETRGSTIDQALELDQAFRDQIRPSSSKEATFCDIATWGYDLIESPGTGQKPVVGTKSQLLVKEPGSRWSSADADTIDNPEQLSSKS